MLTDELELRAEPVNEGKAELDVVAVDVAVIKLETDAVGELKEDEGLGEIVLLADKVLEKVVKADAVADKAAEEEDKALFVEDAVGVVDAVEEAA